MTYFIEIVCIAVDIRKLINICKNHIVKKKIVYEFVDIDLLTEDIPKLISKRLGADIISSLKNEFILSYCDFIIVINWIIFNDNNNNCSITFDIIIY